MKKQQYIVPAAKEIALDADELLVSSDPEVEEMEFTDDNADPDSEIL